jgi:hypothetical protein
MVNNEADLDKIKHYLSKLTMLKYFPQEKSARVALVELACSMATEHQQIEWTVKRILTLYDTWPGPREFRAVFCSRYRPADGIDIVADMRMWPDGLPPDPDLQKPVLKAIASGGRFTNDPALEAQLSDACAKMPRIDREKRRIGPHERRRHAEVRKKLESIVGPAEGQGEEIE